MNPAPLIAPPRGTVGLRQFARLARLPRRRLVRLHRTGRFWPEQPGMLPRPDAAGSTARRPRWRRSTVHRWCAATGRRLPATEASWLLPGPDGPHLERHDTQVLRLDDGTPGGVHVHLARYRARTGGPDLWLATTLAPADSRDLISPAHTLRDQLADALTAQARAHRPDARPGEVLGTVAVLPVGNDSPTLPDLHLVDLPTGPLTWRTARSASAAERDDLADALGHALPRWPFGCATADLVAAWDPHLRPTLHCPIPPPLADAWSFNQRCRAAAAAAPALIRPHLIALGTRTYERLAAAWYSEQETPRPPWRATVSVTRRGPAMPASHLAQQPGSADDAVRYILAFIDDRALADQAYDYHGDPDTVAVAVLRSADLPPSLLHRFTDDLEALSGPPASHRARRLVDALGPAPARLARWPLPGGPSLCAAADHGQLLAVHVPRRMPAPEEAVPPSDRVRPERAAAPLRPVPQHDVPRTSGPLVGEPLDLFLVEVAEPTTPGRRLVGMVETSTGCVLLLPALGDAARLAAAVEHVSENPGRPVSRAGLPEPSSRLLAAMEALAAGPLPRRVPWAQITAQIQPVRTFAVNSADATAAAGG